MSQDSVVIVAAKRTAMGGFMGTLSAVPSTQLGSQAIDAVLADLNKDIVDEVINDYIFRVFWWKLALQPTFQLETKQIVPL